MKAIKKISVMCLSLMISTSFAQIKVASSGNVGVGLTTGVTPLSVLTVGTAGDATRKVSIEGTTVGLYSYRTGSSSTTWPIALYGSNNVLSGNWNVGVRAHSAGATSGTGGRSFGVLGSAWNSTSGYNYGVFGTISGSENGAGIVGTIGYNLDVNVPGIYAGYFVGDVKITGAVTALSFTPSDKRLKKNITQLDQPKSLSGILSLKPVEYNLEQRFIKSKGDTAKVDKPYYDEKSQLYTKKHFGLLAQEIQTIYPDLVYEDQEGYLAVDYIGIVPLLIQSVKELSAKVDALSTNGAKLKSAVADDFSGINLPCQLYQNVPNPFSTSTIIKYSLSNDITTASILIFDMQGKLLKTEPLKGIGEGSITIHGSSLTPGMYIYALVANGKEIDTKRMILTK